MVGDLFQVTPISLGSINLIPASAIRIKGDSPVECEKAEGTGKKIKYIVNSELHNLDTILLIIGRTHRPMTVAMIQTVW